jgi:hypothetical protein
MIKRNQRLWDYNRVGNSIIKRNPKALGLQYNIGSEGCKLHWEPMRLMMTNKYMELCSSNQNLANFSQTPTQRNLRGGR